MKFLGTIQNEEIVTKDYLQENPVAIIDVAEFPTTDIKDNTIYRKYNINSNVTQRYTFLPAHSTRYSASSLGITDKFTEDTTNWSTVTTQFSTVWDAKMVSSAQGEIVSATVDGATTFGYYKSNATPICKYYFGNKWYDLGGNIFTDVDNFSTATTFEGTIQRKKNSNYVGRYSIKPFISSSGWHFTSTGIEMDGTVITYAQLAENWEGTYNTWFLNNDTGDMVEYIDFSDNSHNFTYLGNYTEQFNYQCKFCKDGALYDLGGNGTTVENFQVKNLPQANASNVGKIYQYIGTSNTSDQTFGYFYKCVASTDTPPSYSWKECLVQEERGINTLHLIKKNSPVEYVFEEDTEKVLGWIFDDKQTFFLQYKNEDDADYGSDIYFISTIDYELHDLTFTKVSSFDLNGVTEVKYLFFHCTDDSINPPSFEMGTKYLTNQKALVSADAYSLGGRTIINAQDNESLHVKKGHIYNIATSGTNRFVDAYADKIDHYTVMPTASAYYVGAIAQYIGATTTTAPIYVKGYFYVCIENTTTTPSTYSWNAISVQEQGNPFKDVTAYNITDENIIQRLKITNLIARYSLKETYTSAGWYLDASGLHTADDSESASILLIANEWSIKYKTWFDYNPNGDLVQCYLSDGVTSIRHISNYTEQISYECKFCKDGVLYPIGGSSSSAGQTIQVDTMPAANASLANKIYQYIGNTTDYYTQGYFYKCGLNDTSVYVWQNCPTQTTYGKTVNLEYSSVGGVGYYFEEGNSYVYQLLFTEKQRFFINISSLGGVFRIVNVDSLNSTVLLESAITNDDTSGAARIINTIVKIKYSGTSTFTVSSYTNTALAVAALTLAPATSHQGKYILNSVDQNGYKPGHIYRSTSSDSTTYKWTDAYDDKLDVVTSLPTDGSYSGKTVLYKGNTTDSYTKGHLYECLNLGDWYDASPVNGIVDVSTFTTSYEDRLQRMKVSTLKKRYALSTTAVEDGYSLSSTGISNGTISLTYVELLANWDTYSSYFTESSTGNVALYFDLSDQANKLAYFTDYTQAYNYKYAVTKDWQFVHFLSEEDLDFDNVTITNAGTGKIRVKKHSLTSDYFADGVLTSGGSGSGGMKFRGYVSDSSPSSIIKAGECWINASFTTLDNITSIDVHECEVDGTVSADTTLYTCKDFDVFKISSTNKLYFYLKGTWYPLGSTGASPTYNATDGTIEFN